MLNYIVGVVGLLIASIQDIKSREISDYIWIIMAIFGFLYSIYLTIIVHNLLFICQSAIGFLVCFFLGYFMFLLGAGGGDGKLFMGIGALIPKYYMPIYSSLGLLLNYNPYIPSFPIMVFINALFLSIIIPIVIFIKNIIRGYKPRTKKEIICMFIGEKMKVSDAIKKERIVLGNQENLKLLPSVEESYDISKYDKNEEVWVTPSIPFVVPIFLSYLLTPIIGDKIIEIFLSILNL
ncbi:Preflagellin peptidase [Methanocaldococcus lauensis]|nr:Preflagellin peptidase [Methanocaldococcus lauensis]